MLLSALSRVVAGVAAVLVEVAATALVGRALTGAADSAVTAEPTDGAADAAAVGAEVGRASLARENGLLGM